MDYIPPPMNLRHLLTTAYRVVRSHRVLFALLFFTIVIPWFIFLEIAEDIWESGGFIGDKPILKFLHRHYTPWLTKLALGFTFVGGPNVMIGLGLLILGVLIYRHYRSEAWFFFLSVGGAITLNLLAKAIFGRPRPALWPSPAPGVYYSFPSGHAMGSAALAATLGFLVWHTSWRWPVVVVGTLFALGVGLSRLYLGVHFPSDVVAGWVCSVGWVGGLHVLFSPAYEQLRTWWLAVLGYWEKQF